MSPAEARTAALLADTQDAVTEAIACLDHAERIIGDLRAELAAAQAAIRVLLPTASLDQIAAVTDLLIAPRVVVH